ncbi:MAG: hypothetical protein D6701_08475 [Gemmatimonadetes bacterium]|nr:MAG: hypothetical protein D6701_08475 [Gemmatimonadota bacterium]
MRLASAFPAVAPIPSGAFRLLGFLLLVLLVPASADAQRLSLGVERVATGYDDVLEGPLARSFMISLPVGPGLALRGGFLRGDEDHTVRMRTCVGLCPGDAPLDTFDGSSRLEQWRVGLEYSLPGLVPARPRVFAGLVVSELSSEFVGRETGVRLGPIEPDGRVTGWEVGASVRPWSAGLFSLEVEGRLIDSRVSVCGADAWFAFCEGQGWWSLGLALVVDPRSVGG